MKLKYNRSSLTIPGVFLLSGGLANIQGYNGQRNGKLYQDEVGGNMPTTTPASRSTSNMISMFYHYFSWSQLWCISKLCVLGANPNGWCRYGCHCGVSSSMEDPQDTIDDVCLKHDRCWEETMVMKNCSSGYWEHYRWDMVEEEIFCYDLAVNNECELEFCNCDKTLVMDMKNELQGLGYCPQDPLCPAR